MACPIWNLLELMILNLIPMVLCTDSYNSFKVYHKIDTPEGEHIFMFSTPWTLQEEGYAIFHMSDLDLMTSTYRLLGSLHEWELSLCIQHKNL